MSETSVKTISELLNEEKWTRATLNSYTISNFKDMDALIARTLEKETKAEIKALCDEHLVHTKNSVIALYISGIISLGEQILDDSHLLTVINIFADNHKWVIVEFLCNRILQFGENKYALRILADCYEKENEEEKLYPIWERLIKVDHEEADIVRLLAEHAEGQEDIEDAVEYYKKAIHRYINKKTFAAVKDLWRKLIQYAWEEWEFFFHVDSKISRQINSDRAAQLLEELYAKYKEKERWDKCIEILKRILNYDSKNQWARKEMTDCFKEKFSYHSQLNEYIRLSNLTQSWRNVHDAIADFEKHISFDEGNFVFHRSWGIGRINSIKGDEILIDFTRKRNHSMSLKMAVNALTYLEKEHIWVLKVTKKREDLRQKIIDDMPWALKTIIKSYENACTMKQVKAELVPSILTNKEWTSWSATARKILKSDPAFGNLMDKIDCYMVREKPISKEEKCFTKFKAAKNFYAKYKVLKEFLTVVESESEYLTEIFAYFANYLRAYSNVDDQVIASYFVVSDIVQEYPFLNPNFLLSFEQLIEEIDENIETIFTQIDNATLKQRFLDELKVKENWPTLYARLFPRSYCASIVTELEKTEKKDLVTELFSKIIDSYKELREAFIWIARSYGSEEWCENYGFPYEKILIGMLHLLDITYREISSRREVSLNRKLNKQIHNWLFREKKLEDYILKSNEISISRIYTLMDDVRDLDPTLKIDLKKIITDRFPNFKFYGVEVEKEIISRGLLVTEKAFKLKQQEYRHIIEVEIPENSAEIGTAIEKGDLSENAEYKAGKERQELLNINANKLKEDLDKAQVYDLASVTGDVVAFGTKVTLENLDGAKEEIYTLLGPWESDPSNNIISYMAPFGMELLNHKKGEKLRFSINDRNYSMAIKDIQPAEY